MHAILKITIVSLCLAVASAGHLPRAADINLMHFFMQSREVSQQNPTRSVDCFNYYLPLLNEIGTEYEQSYAACVDAAEAALTQVDDQMAPQRTEMADSATSSCTLLNNCVELKDSISYFECFESAGAANSKTMYSISANASDVLGEVREQYRLVQNTEYRCTNASERTYVEKSSATYDQFQSCLQGKTPVPTTTAATPTTEPTTTPTTTTTDSTTTDTTVAADEAADGHNQHVVVKKVWSKFSRNP